MRHCLVMWLGVLLFGTAMAADVPVGPDPSGEGPPPEAMPRARFGAKEAQQLIAEGNLAMRESNTDPDRIVDAAFAFTQALKFYEKTRRHRPHLRLAGQHLLVQEAHEP